MLGECVVGLVIRDIASSGERLDGAVIGLAFGA
jgi:hypothetical protein